MVRVILFDLLQLFASVYAIARGGAPERIAGASLLVAAVLTRVLYEAAPIRFGAVEVGVLLVDGALLAVLLAIALHADRWWTLWAASLHALGTGAHVVRAIDPTVARMAYAILVASWSYPIIALLIAGTVRHHRRLRRHGRDPSWSRSPPA